MSRHYCVILYTALLALGDYATAAAASPLEAPGAPVSDSAQILQYYAESGIPYNEPALCASSAECAPSEFCTTETEPCESFCDPDGFCGICVGFCLPAATTSTPTE